MNQDVKCILITLGIAVVATFVLFGVSAVLFKAFVWWCGVIGVK